MRASIPVLLALSLPSLAFAEPGPPPTFELTLTVAPEHPRLGQRVYWLGRLNNLTKRTLQVPKRLPEWLHFFAHHQAPDDHGGFGHGIGHENVKAPIEWRPLGPGEAIELGGDVGDHVEACRRGCPEGTLSMTFELALPPSLSNEGLPEDHVLPKASPATEVVKIAPPEVESLERTSPSAVGLRINGVKSGRAGIVVRITLTNHTESPLWLPKGPSLAVECDVQEEGVLSAAGSRSSFFPDPTWSLADAQRVAPGRSLDTSVTCENVTLPARATLRLAVEPIGLFDARRTPSPPFVWAGRADAEWRDSRR